MTSHFRINVAKVLEQTPHGPRYQHMFATAEHSLRDKEPAWAMLMLMQDKFPESEGYKVDMVYWECRGAPMLTWTQQMLRHAQHIKTLNTQGSDIAVMARFFNPAELLELRGEIASTDLANMRCVLAYHVSHAYWMLVNGMWYRK